ncbi:hypothetical protein NHH73_13710 [Oxalobacteraceae bacterium OTU3CINTB1]|nr:hypothetical protein NHH73_13710 [Oxalobacteraceae bacterium OTU3CINTB1]
MAVDRVSASGRIQRPAARAAARPGVAAGTPPLAAGAASALGADAAEALPLPLSGLETLAAALAAAPQQEDEPSAMRANQVFLSRQLVWQTPDSAAMAASWHTMVRAYGERRAAWLEQASGRHVPSSLFMADHTPAAMRDGRQPPPLVTEIEPWRFAVFARGNQRLVLKVVIEDEQPGHGQRRHGRAALRLELVLPGQGRVLVQLETAAGNGVLLELATVHASAMRHLRGTLPRLALRINGCGLTIVRCRLRGALAPACALQPSRAQAGALSPALFRAMAEVATLLSRPPAQGHATRDAPGNP